MDGDWMTEDGFFLSSGSDWPNSICVHSATIIAPLTEVVNPLWNQTWVASLETFFRSAFWNTFPFWLRRFYYNRLHNKLASVVCDNAWISQARFDATQVWLVGHWYSLYSVYRLLDYTKHRCNACIDFTLQAFQGVNPQLMSKFLQYSLLCQQFWLLLQGGTL